MDAATTLVVKSSHPLPLWPMPRTPGQLPRRKQTASLKPHGEQAVKRSRQSKPKVKTGCITCKSEDLDNYRWEVSKLIESLEPQSEKSNATKSNPPAKSAPVQGEKFKCDGYGTDNAQDQRSDRASRTPSYDSDALVVAAPIRSFGGTSEERRSFEFFCSKTSLQLSGFFDSTLWTKTVLQAAHHEPAIRHAVLALSALHERFERGDRSVVSQLWSYHEGGFALQQYNAAIQQLIAPKDPDRFPVDICLLTCLLFASFESLRGHHGSALSHVSAGVKILSEIKKSATGRQSHEVLRVSTYPVVGLNELEVLFNRLDAQVTQLIGTMPMTLSQNSEDPPLGFHPGIPTVFTSLEEARNSFDFHWNGAVHLFNTIGDGPTDEKRDEYRPEVDTYVEIFQRWAVAFEAFLYTSWDSFDRKSQRGAQILQMLQIVAATNLDVLKYDISNETVWDKYINEYRREVELIEAVLKDESHATPYFCLEMNFVAPLYAVAHKCRDPVIRRRAVALLASSPRQEGIWESTTSARVAARLISLEEKDLGEITCCEDVPDWARLSEVQVKFDLDGHIGTIKYCRASETKDPRKRQDFVEVMTW